MDPRSTKQNALFLARMQQLWFNPQPQYCSPHQQSNPNGIFIPVICKFCTTFQDVRLLQHLPQLQRPPQQTSGTNTWFPHNHWYEAYEHLAPTQPLQPIADQPPTWQWPSMFNTPTHHLHPSPTPPRPPSGPPTLSIPRRFYGSSSWSRCLGYVLTCQVGQVA